jgi:SAM-dependent methyltransferase
MDRSSMNNAANMAWQDPQGSNHEGPRLGSLADFDVIDCAHCRFKHIVPIPTPEQLQDTYSHEYYSLEKPLYIERYLEDKEWWDSVYTARYEMLEKHLDSSRRTILDVGSGPGLFLLKGKERGWEVKGIEPSRQAASYSRNTLGLDVSEHFLDERSAPALGKFDALNMSLVLEHLPDPAGMLKIANGLLAENGLICIVAPNDFNPFQTVLRDHVGFAPWWIAPPHHLNYFNFASMAALLERSGFAEVHREATFPIDMFLLMGKNYVGNDSLGRECHLQRKTFELNLARSGNGELARTFYSKLAEIGLGREIVIFAKKL